MKKNINFIWKRVGDVEKATATYNGVSATYHRVGDFSRLGMDGRGNARQIKHLLKEFIRSAKGVDG